MPSYRSSSNALNGSAGSLTLNCPTGVSDGDYLVMGITVGNNRTITGVPAGWTQDYNASHAGLKQFYVYVKLAASEPASWTWTFSGSGASTVAACAAIQDLDQITPLNISGGQTNASSVNITAPSVTTTVNNCLLVGIFVSSTAGTVTPAGGMTEVEDLQVGSNLIEVAYQSLGAAGATGTRVAVGSAAGANAGWLGAIAPSLQVNKMLFRYATMG